MQKERAARRAVAMKKDDVRFHMEPFPTAPYIHQLNDPKHAANVSQSMRWAQVHRHSVNWVTAHDYPLHRDDQAFVVLVSVHRTAHSRMRVCISSVK